jgi:hypothetical protein
MAGSAKQKCLCDTTRTFANPYYSFWLNRISSSIEEAGFSPTNYMFLHRSIFERNDTFKVDTVYFIRWQMELYKSEHHCK